MDDSVIRSWENFLNPEVLRSNLIVTSIYITAFEILKKSIIERLKLFYANGFDQNGRIVSDDYRTKVLSKNESPLYASLQWLKESSAISDTDLEQFKEIKKTRNRMAHEIPDLLGSEIVLDIAKPLGNLISLLNKIELWWITEVDIPTNPDFDGKEINHGEITPGPVISLQLMLDIALGSKEESSWYFKEFRRRTL